MRWTLVLASHIVMFALSGVGAFLLRFDLSLPSEYLKYLVYALPIWILVKITVFHAAKLDRGLWRYLSVTDLFRIAFGNLIASAASLILILLIAPRGFPRSIYALDLMICFLATSGNRLMLRMMMEVTSNPRGRRGEGKSVFIYGAGDAGITLLREIRNNPRLLYHVKGFLDDQIDKKGLRLAGVPVLGGGDEVRSLVTKHNIETILIAIPSASGTEMTRMLAICHCGRGRVQDCSGIGRDHW